MADDLNSQTLRFKSNLKKALIVAVVILAIIAIIAIYFVLTAPKEKTIEEVVTEETVPEQMKPGIVGEIEEGKTLEEVNPAAATLPLRSPGSPTPSIISDTKGEIVSIEDDGIMVMGSGENFEDQKARTLTVKFTEETITFEKGQKIKYVGLAGLNYLKGGEQILISSSENIRGKTEFTADYINKI